MDSGEEKVWQGSTREEFVNNELYKCNIPHLILVSGSQEINVSNTMDNMENGSIDYAKVTYLNTPGHTARGYIIFGTNEKNQTVSLVKKIDSYTGIVRPIWFLYSGMGSQWTSMGANLMRIPIFANAIYRCDKVLRTKGLDIVKIITEEDNTIFDSIVNSFVAMAAIQIGLTDVLLSMGITPNKMIGHSFGEMGCAYADNCLTTEEVILVSYYQGLASMESKDGEGKMAAAAIALGHHKIREICPPEIDIVCQNSPESTTISGPEEAVENFVADITSHSIFAKTVATGHIPFHSRYIANAGPNMLSKIGTVLKNPKIRSEKWLSSCFPREKWNDATCKYASPEYFTHNLLNTVVFDETAQLIPPNAIVIEIAPHGHLQAILKRSHPTCLYTSLSRRGDKNNVLHLLNAIGTLYQVGLNPDVEVLHRQGSVSTSSPVQSLYIG